MKDRVASLDGLRAIAISLVVAVHTFSSPANGTLGVDLFFVLSGYLITTLLLREREATGTIDLRAFYKRRVRRLLPALVVLLVVCVCVALARHEPIRAERAALTSLYGLGFVLNIVVVWTHWQRSAGLSHLWSLAQEKQFYLLWPLGLILLGRWKPRAALIALGVAAALIVARELTIDSTSLVRVGFGPDTRTIGIVAGCLLAVALRTRAADLILKVCRALAPIAAVGMGLIVVLAFRDVYAGWVALFVLAATVVLASVLNATSLIARLLAFGPIAYLGRISYSLYLWHYPIMVSAGLAYGAMTTKIAGIVFALIAASLSYHLVEQPFLRRGRPGVLPVPGPGPAGAPALTTA